MAAILVHENLTEPRSPAGFIAAHPPLAVDVLLSLPASEATALVLVDYALTGLTTPTAWPREVADRLPRETVKKWKSLRPLIAHGTVWRDFVLRQLPVEHGAHRHRDAWRHWTGALSAADWARLVVDGVLSGLRYYREQMQPNERVEQCLVRVGSGEPSVDTLADPVALRSAARALAHSWGTPAEPVVELALAPVQVEAILIGMLDELWENGFGTLWNRELAVLERTVSAARRALPSKPAPDELLINVTGRRPANSIIEQMRAARRIVFIPSPQLGHYISVEEVAYGHPEGQRPGEWRVMYEPPEDSVGADSPVDGESSDSQTPQLTDLADLAVTLEALGDRNRVAILQLLHAHGELFTGEVARRLGVHQSTASRHLNHLEAARLVHVRRDGKQKFYTVAATKLQTTGALLQRTFR